MCTGRVDMAFVLRAFSDGADGVFIGGCWPGECHYVTEGNYLAFSMMHLTRRLLAHIGLDPARLRFEWVSGSEGGRFAEAVNDFSRQLKSLGPLGRAEQLAPEEIQSRLAAVSRLVPYIKIAKRDKLFRRLENVDDYEALYSEEEVAALVEEAVSYHIDPGKCQACMICYRRCPVDAIEGGKNLIHVIDQEKCIKCGTCFEVCPPRFGAVCRSTGEPVPEPLPAEKRVIARTEKRRQPAAKE